MTIKELDNVTSREIGFRIEFCGCITPLCRDKDNPLFIAAQNFIIDHIEPGIERNTIEISIKTIPATANY